jgi:hypothetical protein
MTDCAAIEKVLPRHLADPDDAVAAHLESCAACRARRDALEASLSRFAALPRVEPPARVWEAIEEGLAREAVKPPSPATAAAPPPRRRWAWLVPAWGMAAAALVMIVVLFTGPRTVRHMAGTAEYETKGRELRIETPQGTIVATATRVWVDVADAAHVDVRILEGSANVGGSDAKDGAWVTLSPGGARSTGTAAEFAKFVREREQARRAGRAFSKNPYAYIYFAPTGYRTAAEALSACAAVRMKLDAAKESALRDAFMIAAAAGAREGLPKTWLAFDVDDLPRRASGASSLRIKRELVARVTPLLDATQLHTLREALEDDDDDDEDGEDD